MKGKEIHRTKPVVDTVDPIWTLETGSLFVLQMSPEEFFSSTTGMTFVVKDYKFGGSTSIGHVSVSLESILHAKGERWEHEIKLHHHPASPSRDRGKKSRLFIRVKEATDSDIEVSGARIDCDFSPF
jgi:hypothetical protein